MGRTAALLGVANTCPCASPLAALSEAVPGADGVAGLYVDEVATLEAGEGWCPAMLHSVAQAMGLAPDAVVDYLTAVVD